MLQPRQLACSCLVLLLFSACTAQSKRVAPGPQRGVLGVGSSVSGKTGDGARWSLAVVEEDVRLAVGGAVVLFLGAAPSGRLRFEHVEAEERWVLELPCGTVRCRGSELEVQGVVQRLESGKTYRFDAAGQLLAPRAD